MSSNTMESRQHAAHLGWAGTLAAVWSLAGGAAGGLLIAALLVTGRLHPQGALIFAVGLAVMGSILGTIHGGILGRISRPPEPGPPDPHPLLTALAIATSFMVAIAFALWLALSALVARSGRALGWFALVAVAIIAFLVLTWATLLGWRALERAYHQWPEHRLGLFLMVGAFALLLLLAVGIRPAIPGTDVQLSKIGYVVVAAMAALWIATPAIIVALRIMHRRH